MGCSFVSATPPAESQVSHSSLTDSFGPVKLQRSYSLPRLPSPSSNFYSSAHIPPQVTQDVEEKPGQRFQRNTRDSRKKERKTDKLSSESTKMQRQFFCSILLSLKKGCFFFTSFKSARLARASSCQLLASTASTTMQVKMM